MAGRCVGVLCRRLCSSTAAPVVGEQVKPGFWERMKNKKFVVWTKSLLHDYGEACKDIAVGAKERPGKAALYISLLTGVGICSSRAPTEDSFQSSMLDASSCLLFLSPWTRSGKSDQHVQRLMELSNQGRLRHINLLIFSLMYEAPYDPECDLYSTQCSHLKPRWSEFPDRVLDIGFFGRWWLLQNKMEDFDINEEEFAHLPAHMRDISYNDLHSEENEKLYQSKCKPIVISEEQLEKMEAEGQLKYMEAEEQLRRMKAEEQLKHMDTEEQLKHMDTEEQLKHMDTEEQLKHMDIEEQLKHMDTEERLIKV
ncbi:mitochondrial import inner membrane translocase subunit Tim29 [Mantella aurantiaca]